MKTEKSIYLCTSPPAPAILNQSLHFRPSTSNVFNNLREVHQSLPAVLFHHFWVSPSTLLLYSGYLNQRPFLIISYTQRFFYCYFQNQFILTICPPILFLTFPVDLQCKCFYCSSVSFPNYPSFASI